MPPRGKKDAGGEKSAGISQEELLKQILQVNQQQLAAMNALHRESEDFRKDLRALSLVQQWSMESVAEQLKILQENVKEMKEWSFKVHHADPTKFLIEAGKGSSWGQWVV